MVQQRKQEAPIRVDRIGPTPKMARKVELFNDENAMLHRKKHEADPTFYI